MRILRIVIALSLAVVVLAAGAIVWLLYTQEQGGQPAGGAVAVAPGVELGGPFTMVNGSGETVTEQDFRGRWMLLFFGFTHCPDVCPTELADIGRAMDLLDPQVAEKVTPVFVSVDPERDGPAEVKEYAGYFHPALVGLTGSPQQVAQMAKRWRVFYRKVDVEGGGYTVDHSSFTYLMGPDGKLDALLRYGTPPEEIAAAVRNAVAEGGGAGT